VLTHPDSLQWLLEGFADNGINPNRLTLELLEDEGAVESEERDAAIQQLAALGIKLSMDDFGAGYSNLERMRSMPFDSVKLDQGLLTKLSIEQPRTIRFLAGLIDIVQGLGLHAVMEGLSTSNLVTLARELGADYGQGYALAQPLIPQSVPGWIRSFYWRAFTTSGLQDVRSVLAPIAE
jgi:EAL domain-containing protein (putative c-di-GMP-specific phosphodiesterase class I)